MTEQWKPVEGYEGLYEISDHGRVKSVRYPKQHVMTVCLTQNGYGKVTLSNKGKKSCSIHRTVAQMFIPNPYNNPEVNHIDGNKLNNQVSNLEWATSSENQKHAFDTGLQVSRKGEDGSSILTNDQVLYIRAHAHEHYSKHFADMFGVKRQAIDDIISGKNWKHLDTKTLKEKGNATLTLDLDTGIYYDQVKLAYESRKLPWSLSYFKAMLNGRQKNITNFIQA